MSVKRVTGGKSHSKSHKLRARVLIWSIYSHSWYRTIDIEAQQKTTKHEQPECLSGRTVILLAKVRRDNIINEILCIVARAFLRVAYHQICDNWFKIISSTKPAISENWNIACTLQYIIYIQMIHIYIYILYVYISISNAKYFAQKIQIKRV